MPLVGSSLDWTRSMKKNSELDKMSIEHSKTEMQRVKKIKKIE